MNVNQTASGLAWVPRSGDERAVMAMAQQHGISELLARVLVGRGVALDDAPKFLNPTLREYLPDPSHLLDMDKAVVRILKAIKDKEAIAVFGDYDVDGATSSALLVSYFAQLGIPLRVYIPDRMKEGYGPTVGAFEKLINGIGDWGLGIREDNQSPIPNPQSRCSLILTVDCGTLAHEPIAYAQSKGVDVIVLDHHLSSGDLPNAHAIVNPNRVDETSEHRQLAAVGVVFLLLVALNKGIRDLGFGIGGEGASPIPNPQYPIPNLLTLLDLVALGTVCDVMPLTGLNRAYVAQGLKILKSRAHEGLAALADVARLNETPTTYHLGFLLGPRINAGGRVGASDLGVKLLTTHDTAERLSIAGQLDQLNAERQAIEASVLEQAMAQAQSQSNAPVIVVAQSGWHAGVIGIVAARLKEQFSRPAAVIALEGGQGKGSARSVLGADFGAAIHAAHTAGIIEAGGGHAMAAGFSVNEDNVAALHAFLIERLGPAVAAYNESRVRKIDGWLSVAGATNTLLEELSAAEPYGLGNPSPRFAIRDARIVHREVMKEIHLRLTLTDDTGARLNAVAFKCVGTPLGTLLLNERQLHLAGELKVNRWQGRESVQFIIEDAGKV